MNKIKNILLFLISGEFIFSIFLIQSASANVYNFLPRFLTPTLLFLLWSLLVAIKRLINQKHRIFKSNAWGAILFLLFILVLTLSLSYTDSKEYSRYKALVFISYTAWAYFGVFFILNSQEAIKKFFFSVILTSIYTAIKAIYQYYTIGLPSGVLRAGVDGGNPIELARFSALAILCIIVLFIYSKKNWISELFSIIGIGILIFSIFISGSRMPFISLVFIISLLLVFSIKSVNKTIRIKKGSLRILFLAFTITVVLITIAPPVIFGPLVDRLSGGGDGIASSYVRIDMLKNAYKMWSEAPFFGSGVGSFAIYYSGIDEKLYPHNIFLEVLSELGLVGFSVLSGMIIFAVKKGVIALKSKSEYSIMIMLSFIFLLINANTTGDLNDNRTFFSFLALSTLSSSFFYKKVIHNGVYRHIL